MVEQIARTAPNLVAFQQAAIQVPGVMSDEKLLAEIMDPNGIWARIRGAGA